MTGEDQNMDVHQAPSARINSEPVPAGPRALKVNWWNSIKERGSLTQIVIAATLASVIGLIVTTTPVKRLPNSRLTPRRLPPATGLVLLMGQLWLRALNAIGVPLIICSMILAIQRLREVATGRRSLALCTVGYFIWTTLSAIILSCIMVSMVWSPMFATASGQMLEIEDAAKASNKDGTRVWEAVGQIFESIVPKNIFGVLVNDELLAILCTSLIVGCLLPGSDSSLLRAVVEIEHIVSIVLTELIKLAPIGIFFLILGHMFEMHTSGLNTAASLKLVYLLIGSTVANMALHLFVVLPIVAIALTRMNPYWYWLKIVSAWDTALNTASSSATLPVTLRCGRARGIPNTICKFALPLGCLVNMNGTAIYLPIAVVFLARAQGVSLHAVDYVLLCLKTTLSSIGTPPVPSASLALISVIASSVGVPATGMFSVLAILDWFLDRLRTVLNVSGDLFGAMVIHKITKIEDSAEEPIEMSGAGTHEAADTV